MRIEHVLPGLTVAGAPKLVAALARFQHEQGHRVTLHTMGQNLQLAEELGNIEISPLPPVSIAKKLFLLKMRFATSRPDVVHCHNIHPTLTAAPAAKWAGVPAVVSTRHGLGLDARRGVREFAYWRAARYCDATVGVCEASSIRITDAVGAQPHKVITIPNGARRASRSGSPVPRKQGFTLLNVAVHRTIKDQATLLRAFALAREKAPDIHLWMVGTGPEQGRLKGLAAELGVTAQVVFAGVQRSVGDWLAAADVFVLSSVSEGLPLSLIEATAAGLPSVVTDVGAMPEVIRACGTGAVVPARNPAALSEALLDFSRRRDQLPALRVPLTECYQRHYTVERMAQRYSELYERFAKPN